MASPDESSHMLKKIIACLVTVCLVGVVVPTAVSATPKYDNFVASTYAVLYGVKDKVDLDRKSFRAGVQFGVEVFGLKGLARARSKEIKVLCEAFALSKRGDGDTKNKIGWILSPVWKTEKIIVDKAIKIGVDRNFLDGLMATNFTILANGINVYCPKHSDLMFGRFSSSLRKRYTSYLFTQGFEYTLKEPQNMKDFTARNSSVDLFRGTELDRLLLKPVGVFKPDGSQLANNGHIHIKTRLKRGSTVDVEVREFAPGSCKCVTQRVSIRVGARGYANFGLKLTANNELNIKTVDGEALLRMYTHSMQ